MGYYTSNFWRLWKRTWPCVHPSLSCKYIQKIKSNTVHADSQFLTYTPKFQFQQYPHATALLVVTHVTRTQTIHSQVSSPRYSTDIESRQRAPTIRSSRRYITVEHPTTRSDHGTSTTRTLNAHHRALNGYHTRSDHGTRPREHWLQPRQLVTIGVERTSTESERLRRPYNGLIVTVLGRTIGREGCRRSYEERKRC